MDYENYTYKELLSDDFFLESISNPTAESEWFWYNQALKSSRLSEEIALAKEIIVSASYCRHHITREAEEKLFERIGETLGNQHKASRSFFLRAAVLSVAVFLVVLISGSLFLFDYLSKNNTLSPPIDSPADGLPELTSEIRLIKPDGNVTLEGDTPAISYDDQGEASVNSENRQDRVISASPTTKSEPLLHQLIVPYAKRSFLTLSDGSKIWLNANTRLTYPAVFDDAQREVYVEGEIYLEVAPDAERPFTVRTKEMDINVLGTSFNVSAYGNNNAASVVLVGGKVNVSTKDNRETVVLSPGEIALLTHHRLETGRVDTENYVSWRLGRYVFKQESFSTVLQKLSNYYGRELRLDHGSEDFFCSGTLSLKDNLEQLLQSLEKAYSITFHAENNRILVSVQSKKQNTPMGEK